jgi:AcrR family transcriptional regulator
MGRQQNIDRDEVLDAAEQIVLTQGAAGLTMDAVARAVGITKGGVQYCFGTKQGMVDAMVERWCRQFQGEIDERTRPTSDPVAAIRGYVEATASITRPSHARAAGLMAMLLQSPGHLDLARRWYREHLQPLDLGTPEGRQARIAFMAMEDAFVLRSFGFMHMEDAEWAELYEEIKDTLPPAGGEDRPAKSYRRGKNSTPQKNRSPRKRGIADSRRARG